ncbi:MAG: alpha/beta hydrolase [Candidatus Bipolaricaulota bacterium]
MLGLGMTFCFVGLLSSCSGPASRRVEERTVRVSSGEAIGVLRVGRGDEAVVLLAGNNCSGEAFRELLCRVAARADVYNRYTFYALDYRGSGRSTYHHPITSLDDFAADFAEVIESDSCLRRGDLTLVGHSMGFGVAQCLAVRSRASVSRLISLAGIGTRGVRVMFSPTTGGTDPQTGKHYALGDWADSIDAVAFQQRSLWGEQRSPEDMAAAWNLVVFNEVLAYDLARMSVGDPAYLETPAYRAVLEDVQKTQYMPESLYASHMFNFAAETLSHRNQDGAVVTLPGADRLDALAGLDVLLVKAETDRLRWRGDLVIADSITQNTKYDLRVAGANVTAVMLKSGRGYDHGFPIHRPAETLQLITAFVEAGTMDRSAAAAIFGSDDVAVVYSTDERDWERETYGGF